MSDETNSTGESTPAAIQFTEEQLNAVINMAVTSQLKRQAKELQETFEKRLADLKPTTAAPEPEQTAGKKSSPEFAAMEQKLSELQKNFIEQQARADAAEKSRRDDRSFNDLRAHLEKHVRPELKDIAARDLFHAQKRVSFDEAGNPLFKIRRPIGPGMGEEEVDLPLEDGIQAWLKTKEAAAFLPAPGGTSKPPLAGHIRGSAKPSFGPGGAPKYDKPAHSDEEKIRRAQEYEEFILSQRSKA